MEQAHQPAERSQPQTKVIQKRGNIGISAPLADLSIFPASALVMVVAKFGSFPTPPPARSVYQAPQVMSQQAQPELILRKQ
jgi:hypothetical protein